MWNHHGNYDGYGMHDSMGTWGGWLMLLVLLLTLVVLGVGVGLALWSRSRRDPGQGSGAGHILAERYARGEIDDEEYARRLKVLSAH